MSIFGFLFRSTSKNKDKKNNKSKNKSKREKSARSKRSGRKNHHKGGGVSYSSNVRTSPHKGGGFVIDVAKGASIGGQAPRHGYSECCPPMYHKGDIAYTNSGNQLCGGGKKKRHNTKNKRNNKRKSNVRKRK